MIKSPPNAPNKAAATTNGEVPKLVHLRQRPQNTHDKNDNSNRDAWSPSFR